MRIFATDVGTEELPHPEMVGTMVRQLVENASLDDIKRADLGGYYPDVIDPLRFLREREVVHFQRFGEALRIVQEHLNSQKFFPVKTPGPMKKQAWSGSAPAKQIANKKCPAKNLFFAGHFF